MEYKTEKLAAFHLVGITIRTTNKDNQAQTDIKALWDRIFAENWAAKIPNKLSSDIYSTYIEYTGDYTAPYTYLLGFKVADLESIPEGFTGHTIDAATYHVYTAKGPIPQCIHQIWMHIWHNETQRAYIADFEVFFAETNPEYAELPIYIGVKK